MKNYNALIRGRLRHATDESGLTQRELGRRLAHITHEKWPQSRVWKLLCGRMGMQVGTVAAVAQALGLSIVELIADPAARPRILDLTAEEERLVRELRKRTELSHALLLCMSEHSIVPSPRRKQKPLKRTA